MSALPVRGIPDESSGIAASIAKRPPRVGIIYPSGWGNLGDEAILQATFEGLRECWPDVQLHAFTLHPERTAAGHGVESDFLTGVSRPMFLSARDDGPLVVRAARGVARRTRRVPIMGTFLDFAAEATANVVLEAGSIRSAWSWLKTADLVLAAGGGQLDAVWGGAWGQPYALARWAWLARRAGVPFAFLSVGYGGASSRMSKAMLRYAVSQARYCSLRDSGSRDLTKRLGVTKDLPVVPDLAFALRARATATPKRPGYDVGISPMVFMRPGNWPNHNAADYERYVALWAGLVRDRVGRGDRVHLFVTDPADANAVRDVWNTLDETTRAGCSVVDTNTPDRLLELFRKLDVVISSRLHGVLIAIVAGRPVLALSHERKVRAVMNDAGVSAFCVDLPATTLEEATGRLEEVTRQLDALSRGLQEYASLARKAVNRQQQMLPSLLGRR